MVLLDVATQMQHDFQIITDSLNSSLTMVKTLIGIILTLVGYVWISSAKKQDKTEDKVSKLTDQITRLATLMEIMIPETKENTKSINDIKENCATQKHRKTA